MKSEITMKDIEEGVKLIKEEDPDWGNFYIWVPNKMKGILHEVEK